MKAKTKTLCPVCKDKFDTCSHCKGSGYIYTPVKTCPVCHNRFDTCSHCGGTGTVAVNG